MIELAKAVAIETELARRGAKLKRVGRELVCPCPVCGGRDRFAVNIAKQVWNCRGCQRGGDILDLVQHLDNCSFRAAVQTLTGEQPRRAATPMPAQNSKDYEYSDRRQADKASWLWSRRQPISGRSLSTICRRAASAARRRRHWRFCRCAPTGSTLR
jgi:phage/plasmid primase-like uncharacterized protein